MRLKELAGVVGIVAFASLMLAIMSWGTYIEYLKDEKIIIMERKIEELHRAVLQQTQPTQQEGEMK